MDEEEVTEFVSQCQQLIDASPQMDEENTKAKLIRPFLELLGWDFFSTEVSLEYTVPVGSGNGFVDYALLIGDSPKVFVEAKPVRSTLTDEEVGQLKSYMRQELSVNWGILTNGKSFEVLAKNQFQENGEEISVVQFELDDLTGNPELLEILTKEAIRSGEAEEVAEQVARTNQAIRDIHDNEDAIVTAVSESIEAKTGTLTINLEDHARTFVEDLVSALREQRQFVTDDQPATPPVVSDSDHEGTESSSGSDESDDGAEDSAEGYIVEFSDGTRIEDADASQKSVMGQAVDYLIEEYDLIDELDIPHMRPRAQSNCTINTEPAHPSGRQMRNYYELSDDYYLNTNLNADDKKQWIDDFAQTVGLSVNFAGEW